MATNNRIQTTNLDFDGIKESFKEYLRGQGQFTDYDFEGSGLSVILDILAYNTHYNALYTNLAMNEAFLDSASKRSSVVSKAKELGYVPQSRRAATAVVDMTMVNARIGAPEFIELPAYSVFQTTINDIQYNFLNTESKIAYNVNGQYVFNDITLREGTRLEYRYLVETSGPQSFVIPNAGVDTSTLRVSVQENQQSSATQTYQQSNSLLNVDGTTLVYFLQENANEFYQIEFGNGVVGKALVPGNVVTVEYIVTSGAAANKAQTFAFAGSVPPNTQPFIQTKSVAFGGSDAESIEDIKWNAPRVYASQNRCVTLEDYKTTINTLYPNAQSINVWGGEQNTPPTYGEVYISVKPTRSETLSDSEKAFILNEIIGPRRISTVYPRIVDPTYIYVEVNTTFYYDRRVSTRSATDVLSLVQGTITNYNNLNLDRFDGILKHSQLTTEIDAADPSIRNSITTIRLHREIQPIFNQVTEYTIDLGNPIYNGVATSPAVMSTGINVLNVPQVAYIESAAEAGSQTGILRLFYYQGTEKVLIRNIGTVNFSTGLMKISNLILTGLPGTSFKLMIEPQSYDVVSVRNQIVSIDPALIKITPQLVTDTNNYRFASSRT